MVGTYFRGFIWKLGMRLEDHWSARFLYDTKSETAYEIYNIDQRNCAKAAQLYTRKLPFGLIQTLAAWAVYAYLILTTHRPPKILSAQALLFLDDVDTEIRSSAILNKKESRTQYQYTE